MVDVIIVLIGLYGAGAVPRKVFILIEQKLVALLPIKAHSERVPGKNFKTLGGKPLYEWILHALLDSSDIDKVVINTDAAELIDCDALKNNDRVLIRVRKPDLRGDLVSMNLILEDDIAAVPSESYVMTHATNPFIRTSSIEAAFQKFKNAGDCDSVFSVNKVQTRFYRADGSAVNHDPNNLIRTQDLEPWYEENSCLYFFSKQSFAATNARIGDKPLMYETTVLEAFDIDEPEDWIIAEAYADYLLKRKL